MGGRVDALGAKVAEKPMGAQHMQGNGSRVGVPRHVRESVVLTGAAPQKKGVGNAREGRDVQQGLAGVRQTGKQVVMMVATLAAKPARKLGPAHGKGV